MRGFDSSQIIFRLFFSKFEDKTLNVEAKNIEETTKFITNLSHNINFCLSNS
jgi:hypothetical protein